MGVHAVVLLPNGLRKRFWCNSYFMLSGEEEFYVLFGMAFCYNCIGFKLKLW